MQPLDFFNFAYIAAPILPVVPSGQRVLKRELQSQAYVRPPIPETYTHPSVLATTFLKSTVRTPMPQLQLQRPSCLKSSVRDKYEYNWTSVDASSLWEAPTIGHVYPSFRCWLIMRCPWQNKYTQTSAASAILLEVPSIYNTYIEMLHHSSKSTIETRIPKLQFTGLCKTVFTS
jgi:hypothetical protein